MKNTLIQRWMISDVMVTGIHKVMLTVILATQLVACGGGGGGGGTSSGGTADIASAVSISGSVGDGPIIGATVEIYSARGKLLSSVMSDASASYQLNLHTSRRDYPLLLKVTGGTDLVTGDTPDFQLVSVLVSPSEHSVNINPFSTLVVEMAQFMNKRVNATNVSAAKAIVTGRFAFGLDPSVVGDPVTTQISDSNAANIVKASEVMGEMVRRTRDAMLAGGTVVSGDEVMAAIAADLTDGILDGAGAKGVNPTISSTAKVVSAQVLLEALSNNLKVGGVNATGVIDQAIAITHPGVNSSQLTDSVRITSGMLEQTLGALAAAQVLDSGAAVQNIVRDVGSIASNALPTEVAKVLPADASTVLNHAVTLVPYASTEDIAAINQIVDSARNVDTTSGGTSSSGNSSGSTTGGSVTAPIQPGSLTLQWSAPVSRADGTPLSLADIDGYHIYYGASAGNYPNLLDVPDGTTTKATINNLSVGNYYLVMTTYDVSGLESGYSSMVTKSVK
jgi:hypothetical protein